MTAALLLALALVAPVSAGDAALYDRLVAGVAAAYDSARGGFVARDGLVSEAAVELALLHGRERGDAAWTQRGLATLDWTIGLLDSVGGGFYTRARDKSRETTAFDKMTVPNARRLEVLLLAHRVTGDARWRRAAARVVDYGERVLLDGRGGFVHGQVGDRQLVPESNGAMLRAWLLWGALDGDARRRDFARRSFDRVWSACWSGLPGLVRRGVFGEIGSAPLLTDQIEMGRAYAWGAHLGGRAVDLERARAVADTMLRAYADPRGGLRTRAVPNRKGVVRAAPREASENARAARFLAELAAVTGEGRYREAARALVAAFARDLGRPMGLAGADWALALRALHAPDLPARPEWREVPARPAPGAGGGR